MGLETLHQQLWDVSYDSFQKHCKIANALTSLMHKRAEHLRSQLLDNSTSHGQTFASDFRKAHEELQAMGKSVQAFVSDWQNLLFNETLCVGDTLLSTDDLLFEYIKAPLEYERNQEIQLLVTDLPKTTQDIFCAIDHKRVYDLNQFVAPLQNGHKTFITELPSPGQVFAVKLENCWFRAVRNSPTDSSEQGTIALILLDTGEVIPYQFTLLVAELPEEYRTIPAYIIRCQILPGSTSATFNRFDTISCKVIEIGNDNGLKVELLPESQSKEEQPPESHHAITRDTLSKEELEQLDEMPESTTNAMKAVLGYEPKDDMLICGFYDPKTKGCFKGSNCRKRHVEKDPHGWTRDRDTVSVSVSAVMEIPLPNTYVMLQPTFVVDFETFYTQIVAKETSNMTLSELLTIMNSPEVVAQYKKLQLLPSLGELVLAQYDNVWYRATVSDLFDNDVSVFYVDYGNGAMLSIDEIRMCDDRFKNLPYQAVCCRIANARRVKQYHVEAIEQFTEAILDKQLQALVIDNKHPWEVILYDEDGLDIGERMINAKLALQREPHTFDEAFRIPG